MKQDEVEALIASLSSSDSNGIQRVIGRTFIVEYGIIIAIPSDGVVTVMTAVANSDKEQLVLNCNLLSTCSSNVAVNIVPSVGDKVLILFPRKYNKAMFDKETKSSIISEYASGYNALCGMAILMNQFRPSDSPKTKITINKDKVELDVNGKCKITVDSSTGNVTMDSSGKFDIKNNTTSLKDVIEGVTDIISGLRTVDQKAMSPDTTTIPIATWKASKLNSLLN